MVGMALRIVRGLLRYRTADTFLKSAGLWSLTDNPSERITDRMSVLPDAGQFPPPRGEIDRFHLEKARGQGNILIMDDEDHIRKLTASALTVLGYTVTEAKNGTEAVRYVKDARRSGNAFIGAILDLAVPGGRGAADTIMELRNIDPGLDVIISGAHSSDPIMAHPQQYGFAGRLVKPYHTEELARVIHQTFGPMEICGAAGKDPGKHQFGGDTVNQEKNLAA
jgi:CheY-like chemotaxis protein